MLFRFHARHIFTTFDVFHKRLHTRPYQGWFVHVRSTLTGTNWVRARPLGLAHGQPLRVPLGNPMPLPPAVALVARSEACATLRTLSVEVSKGPAGLWSAVVEDLDGAHAALVVGRAGGLLNCGAERGDWEQLQQVEFQR